MPRKLHIGGKIRVSGWEVFNAVPGPHVDHVGNAADLARFEDNIFQELYASHVLEHFDYTGEVQSTLAEWNRVLIPSGTIYISVPDLDTLCRLFLEKDKLKTDDRFFVMKMIFGGHLDQYDYHVVGLNQEFLTIFLLQAKFESIRRVDSFGFFDDTSTMTFAGVPISLNIVAQKLKQTES